MTTITSDTFDKEVINSSTPVLVDFFATWCGPCKMVSPALEKLSGEYDGKVKFAKIDIDSAENLAVKYSVFSVPSMLVFNNGIEAGRIVGALPATEISKKLNELINK
ncbi:Thioredoxin 1 [bioreactor metagenome]|uniref:Thioredoxin 1 n=1 Tax=bioreactor metagenome TaxID=1076179 RepID=A0A645CN05_9ZZZZ|nr:thioredoxin [Candidatus Metalachnospira sp.]